MNGDGMVRVLRPLLGTVTVVALLAAGGTFAATKFRQLKLEEEAVGSARKLAESTLAPALRPGDAKGAVSRGRYESLMSLVQDELLTGPITGLTLWSSDGTVVFSTERELVGRKHDEMRATIEAIGGAPAVGRVDGDRFLVLVPLEVGKGKRSLTAELARSHDVMLEEASGPWWDWVGIAGRVAAIAFVLYLGAVAASAVLARGARRADARRGDAKPSRRPVLAGLKRAAKEDAKGSGGTSLSRLVRGSGDAADSRRKIEEALADSEHERMRLQERVRQLEGELADARRRLSMSGSR